MLREFNEAIKVSGPYVKTGLRYDVRLFVLMARVEAEYRVMLGTYRAPVDRGGPTPDVPLSTPALSQEVGINLAVGLELATGTN